MAAADAVLSTYELLENITIYVPAWEIGCLRQVSQSWNQLFKASKRICEARCLKPIGWNDNHDTVVYGHIDEMKINLFGCSESRKSVRRMDLFFDTITIEELVSSLDNFATYPRCRALQLQFHRWHKPISAPLDWSCVVYNKSGVTYRDVQAVGQKMKEAYKLYELPVINRHTSQQQNHDKEELLQLSLAQELSAAGP